MAVLGAGNPTLLDQIKRTDPNGSIATIVEALTQRNPILQDATAIEGNLPTGHRITVRSGLPTLGWRRFNEGIDSSKSTTIQVDETVGMLTGRSEIDCALARLNGNEAAFRLSEEVGQLQAMNNEVAQTLFYGNIDQNPQEFQGLTPRFQSDASSQVVNHATISGDAASGAEQSSIWFIVWGPESCFFIYPKGSPVGMQRTDMGKQYIEDNQSTPKKFLAYCTDYEWSLGLCVRDWRQIARIGNIDSSTITLANSDIEMDMIEAINRIYDPSAGRLVIYMNRQVKVWLERQTAKKATMNFFPTDWHGHQIMAFQGHPIVFCDALIKTEAVLAA